MTYYEKIKNMGTEEAMRAVFSEEEILAYTTLGEEKHNGNKDKWIPLYEQVPPLNKNVEIKFIKDGKERIHTNKLIPMMNGTYIWSNCDYDGCEVVGWKLCNSECVAEYDSECEHKWEYLGTNFSGKHYVCRKCKSFKVYTTEASDVMSKSEMIEKFQKAKDFCSTHEKYFITEEVLNYFINKISEL